MKALLIIDMQVESFKPETPRFDSAAIVQRINLLSDYFRQNGDKVVFIQHDGTKENSYVPDTAGWEILPALNQYLDDIVIGKTANDSFYNTKLDIVLKENKITDLFITGCATDFCVDSTVHSALTRDYNVVVIKDCHTTADRPHLSAEKVIQHHNWLWENLTPTKGRIKLVTAKDLLKNQMHSGK